MEEQSKQERWLVLLGAAVCAVIIGYNAFYVPDAAVAWASSPAEPAPLSSAAAAAAAVSSSPPGQAQNAAAGKVDINAASVQELSSVLPGIGDTLAQRIVEYREQNGPFRSAEELMEVPGIGEKTFEAIRDLITAG